MAEAEFLLESGRILESLQKTMEDSIAILGMDAPNPAVPQFLVRRLPREGDPSPIKEFPTPFPVRPPDGMRKEVQKFDEGQLSRALGGTPIQTALALGDESVGGDAR
jgi:hypothetical protein